MSRLGSLTTAAPVVATPALTITVTTPTLPSQLTLAATADLQAAAGISVSGGTAPYTYAWSDASGGTFGDSTALDSSWTPTAGGVHTLVLTVEDADGATVTAVVVVTVGEASAAGGYFVQRHGVLWAEQETLDLLAAGSVTKDGLTYSVQTSNWTSLNIINGVGLVAVSSAGGDARLVRPRVEGSLVARTRRWVAVSLHNTSGKNATLAAILNAAITRGVVLNVALSGGTWTLRCHDTITGSFVGTDFPALAGKPVVFCVEHDSSYSIRGIYYSTEAWTGGWPTFASLTQIKQANVTGYLQTGAEMQRDTAAEVFALGTDVDYGIQQQSSITTTWLGHRVDEAL